jgi:hypothetical protein
VKYVCLVYGEEQVMRTVNDSECVANGAALRRSGHYVAAEALQPATTAATVRVRGGETVVTDGPFAEAKEARLRRGHSTRRKHPAGACGRD